MPTSQNWEEFTVRDPLYGFVDLTSQENRILDTSPLQRLARIKQLAHAYIVYPSAAHTRLEHSLGTLNTAGRMCDQLGLKKNEKAAVRAAALLHDVGHGPFSHLFEEILRSANGQSHGHEEVTRLIIEHDPSVRKALGPLRAAVLEVLEGNSLLSEIISGSLDSDKMDYLRRDSYHTGVAYGVFDFERVVRTVCKIRESGRDYIAIEDKGRDALESYRLARYSMHAQVYEHHARLIADDMFVKAILACIEEGYIPRNYLDMSQPEQFLANYLELDDGAIEHLVLRQATGIPKKLIEDIRARRLLKRAYVLNLTKEAVPNPLHRDRLISMSKDDAQGIEKKMADEVGVEHGYVIVHLQSINIKLYERFEEYIGRKDRPILVRKRDGSVSSLDEESPISASMVPIRRLFVFAPSKHTDTVRKIAEDEFKAKSVY